MELRRDTLRLLLLLAAAGYTLWHLVTTAARPVEQSGQAYLVALVVVPVLVGTGLLLPRSHRAAVALFTGGLFVAISWALVVFESTQPAFLYAVLALVAAFVVHPLLGFAVVVAAVGMLASLASARPIGAMSHDVLQLAILGIVTVFGVWAVMRHLFIVLDWYVDSYDRAAQRTREAQEHRGQLVQALKQLDIAYYRLGMANAALANAWKATEEAERSKSELVVNISHELRTPLNLIAGFAELMVADVETYGGEPLPAAYRGDANAIYRSAQHLLALVDDILDLAQAGVKKLPLTIEPTDVRGVIVEAADLVREYVATKGLTLELDLSGDHVVVPCDRLRIRQVLLNLLTNAARFTEHGSITIKLEARDPEVLITVTDTGRGMPAETLKHMFEEYHHPDQPVSDQSGWHGGTGLGLPISKGLVELHGGTIWVESTVGVGTRFGFTLPRSQLETARSATFGRAWVAHSDSGERLLVLTGANPTVERLLRRHLAGYRIVVADDLAEAYRQAGELHASAIIADAPQSMDDLASPVPIVGLPFSRQPELSNANGVVGYLVKPVSRQQLLAAVVRLGDAVERILVADDDPRAVRLLTRMLQLGKRRFNVVAAHDGDEALASMRATRPDLVLLDLAMPRVDGQEVLNAMAQDARLAGIPVLIVSAHDRLQGEPTVHGKIVVNKAEGFQLAEIVRLAQALLSSLDPPRSRSDARAPVPGGGQPG